MKDLKELLAPYGLSSPEETERLDGYASINYRIKSQGTNYLFKHYTDPQDYKLISEEDRTLKSLLDLPFQVPGSLHEMVTYKDGSFSRLLPFIEGDLLSTTDHSDRLMHHFGRCVAQLNKSLFGRTNDTFQARTLFWDMKYTLLNLEKTTFIEKATDKKVVHYYFDLFEHHILPVQHTLRSCIIHSDLNDNNVLVKGDVISGIIDFGDITYSPLIYEVAIALTYIMLANESQAFEKAAFFLKGYHEVLPLEQREIELLYLLIPSRLCVSVCNSAKKKAEGEDTEYVLISEKPAWRLLHRWITINPTWINHYFLQALGFKTQKSDRQALMADRMKYTGKSLRTSYDTPILMTGGAFQYMYDELGHTYLDAYNNIPHVGHCHPSISRVIATQVRKLNTNTRYLYHELVDYPKKLSKKLPESLHKIFYVNSGSAASDLAIRMARLYTGNDTVAILENGYHGNTITGIAISDYKHNGKGGDGRPQNIITMPLPKHVEGVSPSGEEYANDAIRQLRESIEKGAHPCALIVEPISGCGGQVPLASGYLKKLRPFLSSNNILLIVDEVQTGFGRLGKYYWGFEMHSVVPDIILIGKPMGNGHPVAAAITTETIADHFANGMEFFTSFGGNPVSCAVATEVLQVIEEEALGENALQVGNHLKEGLSKLKDRFNIIGDIRGEGLFLGIEFTDSINLSSTEIATSVKEKLKKSLILVGTDGPQNNVIKIKPPLCFNAENARHFLTELGSILETDFS